MSKAFTREDSEKELDLKLDEEAEEGEAVPGAPRGTRNYISPAGAARLREELRELLHEKRPEVVRMVSWAASNGDRSENADYTYGKRKLRELDRRIRFLTRRLDHAEVVDPAQQVSDRVLFGATVTVRGEEGGERTYSIVGIDEAEVQRGRVSWVSPIAKALLNAQEGDVVLFRSPKGEEELEILSIRYEPLPP